MKIDKLPTCDIVVPIFNSLSYVKTCIDAVLAHTDINQYQLYLINDASDQATSNYLENIANKAENIHLITNLSNLGFVKSCNLGMSKGQSPYILLLNSDVIVTPNWLFNLIKCAESDNAIASVNPLTNNAAQIDLAMTQGSNFYDINWRLQKEFLDKTISLDVVTGVGFCLLLRRSILQKVGLFDEVYGKGYCEESDLCMRLTTQGYRTVVSPDVYVYHQGQASFTHSHERYLSNRQIFDQRWKDEYIRQFRAYKKANPLSIAHDLFTTQSRWHPTPVIWMSYRKLLKHWQQKQLVGLMLDGLRGLKQMSHAFVPVPNAELVAKNTPPNRLRVTYLVNKLVISGGILSVVQIVNELILLGIEARIATLFVDPEIRNWRLLTEPMLFKNEQDLTSHLPETDIVVATHWITASWAAEVKQANIAKQTAYYLQDYEAWFSTEHKDKQTVLDTYALVEHKIVTSDWLQRLLEKDGYASEKICIGTDLDVFYPRDVAPKSHPVLVTMARPGTPWRGFKWAVEALALVKQYCPELEIVFFGDNQLFRQNIPFEYRDEGVVSNQNHLAALYSEADIFLDASDYQGFGRLALEAMSCGTACVLTTEGGVTEYARAEQNCLAVPPRKPNVFAHAILRLIKDSELRERLRANGLETVKQYSIQQEARKTLDYFTTICNSETE
ncbi:glycosyltransferase [Candidatus Albibeggiatoa sp. nov. NOAA]|uniref:glycosyltransferase n=1 Tax=Candidatus Albibeggiatoa sp. nov. NOAA TaxID=3162724 RepID=UPI0032F9CFFB|nr:glycosyltransferase [Thiotrichaceae bacterium]